MIDKAIADEILEQAKHGWIIESITGNSRKYFNSKRPYLKKLIADADPLESLQVSAGLDDVMVDELKTFPYTRHFYYDEDYVWIGSNYVPLVNYRSMAYFRWTSVDIPAGSTVSIAYVEPYAKKEGSPKTRFYGIDEDDTATFSSDPDGRPLTTAYVDWNPVFGTTYDWRQSPNVATIIQEIINRAGWSSGNALGIKWDDHDSATGSDNLVYVRAYEYDTTLACKLEIVYTPPGWTGKVSGVTNPAKVMGVSAANIAKVKGVS